MMCKFHCPNLASTRTKGKQWKRSYKLQDQSRGTDLLIPREGSLPSAVNILEDLRYAGLLDWGWTDMKMS